MAATDFFSKKGPKVERRQLFPTIFVIAAVLFGTLGVLPWIPYGFTDLESYPGNFHKDCMVYGFVTTLILILWLKKAQYSKMLLWPIIIAFAAQLYFIIEGHRILAGVGSFTLLSLTLAALAQHSSVSLVAKQLIGMTSLYALTGSLLELFQGQISPRWLIVSHNLIFKGLLLGGFISAISAITTCLYGKSRSSQYDFFLLLILYLLFLMDGFFSSEFLRPAQGLLLLASSITLWKFYQLPTIRRGIPLWTWLATLSTILGACLSLFYNSYSIHFIHLSYISGIGLIALVLSAHPFKPKMRNKTMAWIGSLLLIAGFTRATAILIAGSYERHLSYSAMLWVIAIILWLVKIYPRLSQNHLEASSH